METISQSQAPLQPDPISPIAARPTIANFPIPNPQYKAVLEKILEQIFKAKENSKVITPPKPEEPPKPVETTIIRLIRPKIDRQVDFSHLIKLPKNLQSPKKKKSQPNSPKLAPQVTTMILRRSTSSFFEPVKNISTPNWVSSKPSKRSSNKHAGIDMETYNISAIHGRIEVYECRIQMGEDEKHLHPALARIAAYESANDDFSQSELEKTQRYNDTKISQKTPLFWPERVYDTEENKMTPGQSEKLMQIIQKVISSVGETKTEKARKNLMRIHSASIPSPSRKSHSHDQHRKIGRPPKINSIAQIYFANFLTDDEDLTDFDF